jgi:hypothetical protein
MSALPVAAVASHDPSGEPFDYDFVRGNGAGQYAGPPGFGIRDVLVINASGENASGFVHPTSFFECCGPGPPNTEFVTCLNVAGHRAVIGWETGGGLVVEDRGGPGQDAYAYHGVGPPGTNCPSPETTVEPLAPLVEGDITVHDAVPLPTSKDQCKNGGWLDFPDFKNQGECVSFVATGGKNPPAG